MNPYENDVVATAAVSVTDASIAIVLALSALFMVVPFAMLVGLLYTGIRERTRKSVR